MTIQDRVEQAERNFATPIIREYPLTIDDTRGRLVLRPGARATIHLEDEGNLPRSLARSTLYWALLDGRCQVPPEVYVELELDRPTPRVIKPGCDIQVA